jgi:starch synthase
MRVLFVTAEAYPLAKSGGLADVSSALPLALRHQNIDVRLMLPAYPCALNSLKNAHIEARLQLMGEDVALIAGYLPNSNLPVWLVHAPSLFCRRGGLYQDESGADWKDNARRFALLAHAANAVCDGRLTRWTPDVVHANDWHAGLLPLLLSTRGHPRPATVFTIHNMAFQGKFPREALSAIDVPERFFHIPNGIEFYGQISYLKSAIRYSDRITTVSPSYANEIMTPEFGYGLEGVLRERAEHFTGILNGIDDVSWNPANDEALPAFYSERDIAGKRICKADLQREFGLDPDIDVPLIGFVSRLTYQKMADVVLEAIPWIIERGAQFILVGEGEHPLEREFERLSGAYPGKVAVHIGYAEDLAHRLQAGTDILLAPARFEPCGLTQLYALRYGTVPVVRKTGGLADTVHDANSRTLSDRSATGFVFEEPSKRGLLEAVARALTSYREPLAWRRLQLHGMAQDFSWQASAAKYAALYYEISGFVPQSGRPFTPQAEEPQVARVLSA